MYSIVITGEYINCEKCMQCIQYINLLCKPKKTYVYRSYQKFIDYLQKYPNLYEDIEDECNVVMLIEQKKY